MLRTLILLIAIAIPLLDAALVRPGRRSLGSLRLLKLERLTYLCFLVAVGIEAVTSFGMLLMGKRMDGWMHVLHLTFAGVFAVTLTVLGLLWAEQSAYQREGETARFYTGEKASFWLTLIAGLVTLLSALLGMMSWFGSDGQNTLFRVHRYSSLALMFFVIFNGYRVLMGRPGDGTDSRAAAGAGR